MTARFCTESDTRDGRCMVSKAWILTASVGGGVGARGQGGVRWKDSGGRGKNPLVETPRQVIHQISF